MAGLKNEQWIRARYEEVCRNNPKEYALISMKIKRFRIFNRMFGWEAGDELITRIYDCVESWLKPEEYIAHIRSGYYLLLVHMPEDYDDIFHYIIEINSRIRDWPYDEKYGKIYMGYGIFRLETNPPDFLTAQYNADICRTESAECCLRNSHFEVYGLTYHDANLGNYNMEQDFRPAIEREDFKLYLQPKVDLRTGEITEAEALVRWIDPVKGMIPVGEFLPELEKNGLIGDLDLYMFQHVCSTINRWLEIYGRKIKISVNLSSNMFNYRYFLDEYKRIYEKVPCPKDCIEFELLESIVLNQLDLVQKVAEQLRDYGFTCSLDDFGSGYSSFSVLTSTELKTLKIDRSLFRNYSDPRERVLVRHIVETAKELDLKIVAEGIETREYVDFLKGLGCDYIQGFIFYKPMPVGEFEQRFLRDHERAQVAPQRME
ncbi:bifunctional diguanylate cyclase/phosphodiesterase [Hungatella hathewayi]|uniref:bifunctional diguanylate cyclase/phosphodiesterase n=1 Tax=Hungatella hathewayi TaxID=154046 RepID=UPI003568C346